ncbi:MAG: PqqD family protein [Anaerolineae bacterium]|nr:PqqD family protein [Anaerolineae bacterium]
MKNPQRKSAVVSEAVGDGLGVFDPQQQQSYVLNATSALVFQHCDGQTTPQQLTDRLVRKFNIPRQQAEELLWLALDELEKANLLQTKVTTTQAPQPVLTRRQMLTTLAGIGLSLAVLPIVSPVMIARADVGGDATTTTGLPFTTTPPPTTTTQPPPTTTQPPTTTTTQPPTTTTTQPPTTTPPPTFQFSGFFPPVDNPPTVNEVKAGRGIPIKFSLNGNQGLAIIAAGYPVSQNVPCQGGMPVDPIEETTTANQGLTYDAGADQYTYVWKTQKSWAGSCRQFILRLSDGASHVALFKFK